jgi:hypothetical protein
MLYIILAILVILLFYMYQKREHLTSVPQKKSPLEKRVETLEDEYKSILQKMDKQEAQAKAATSQATTLQAALHSQIHS